jgi:hypothetical protein
MAEAFDEDLSNYLTELDKDNNCLSCGRPCKGKTCNKQCEYEYIHGN